MTQKTGRLGASGREFCLYSLEKEDKIGRAHG